MIIAAACVIDGEVVSLPAPARHHDIIRRWPKPKHSHGEQGFIDDKLGFVSRREAAGIALEQGQIEALKWPGQLYSEDLW